MKAIKAIKGKLAMLKHLFAALLAASFLITGCKDASGPGAAGGAKSASAPVSVAAIAAEATGFTAGSAVRPNTATTSIFRRARSGARRPIIANSSTGSSVDVTIRCHERVRVVAWVAALPLE